MTHEEARHLKAQCKEQILQALERFRPRLEAVDTRLYLYILDATDPLADNANLYELLGIRKFLRMMDTYRFDTEKVRKIYKCYEFLRFDGIQGKQQYKLTPMQTFQLAAPFGFMREAESPSAQWDSPRRVCTEANYFVPRKTSKTTLAAFFNFWFFFFEDFNAECYCTANSADQSKILFEKSADLIRQMDPEGKKIRFTATEITWYNHLEHQSKVVALTAGGKTKDGLFAQLCCADEYGSAGYVKDKSDMARLVGVVEGSRGPRKEPMTVITTTAGRISEGPYKTKLQGIKDRLVGEMAYPLDGRPHPDQDDWQFALICCPDQWEESDEDLHRPELWRKVNRHIGITVQPDYYRQELRKMMTDPETYLEQKTKLFNIWQADRVKQWLTAADIAPLMGSERVTDLRGDDGWVAFVGCDFSKGDDLNAVSVLCYHTATGAFLADAMAWITEEALSQHSNAALYRLWVEQGWLRVCPGRTINEDMVLAYLMEVAEYVDILAIGYDAYDAKRFINAFRAWIFSLGIDPSKILSAVSQTFATYNSPVQELTYLVKMEDSPLRFSPSPLWQWEFGNCMLQESNDGMENVKPVKSHANAKVDNVQCLCSALHLYDQAQAATR